MSELQLFGTIDVLLYFVDNFFFLVDGFWQFFNMLLLASPPKLAQNFSPLSHIIGELWKIYFKKTSSFDDMYTIKRDFLV